MEDVFEEEVVVEKEVEEEGESERWRLRLGQLEW